MCGPKAPKDNSAELARQAEEQRQSRITQGQSAIDQAFGGFNDDFYTGYQNQYNDFYNPQIDEQYGDASKRLKLQLARTGNLTGSVGANQLADLQKYYDAQKLSISGRGIDAANNLRSNIDNSKSQLYANNRASADPGNATSAAAAAAQSLQPTAPSDVLANVFGGFFDQLGNVNAIKNQQQYSQGSGVKSFSGGNSSGGVVS
jgi:uncharacterized protein YciI